ncbi:MAG: DUF1345 domain-containing protein, partial [Pseudomonadota bacterium]|nr:DUF1345 domain-containing protein [Pseudomonadota bacterium]
MRRLVAHLRVRPRLTVSVAVGVIAAWLLPGAYSAVTRGLFGWNVSVWLYLALAGWMMLRADHARLRQVAVAQAEAAAAVLVIVILAALISLVGIVAELMAAKVPGTPHAVSHVFFALATVAGSWLLVPTTFALTYASQYYRTAHGSGLNFPHAEGAFKPDYADFLYFSFTIAVASQTADVSVSTQAMRRLVLLQSVLSFAFNTAILAFTINIA